MGNKSKSIHEIINDDNLYKPGPTNYQTKDGFHNKSGVFIGTSKRKDLTET